MQMAQAEAQLAQHQGDLGRATSEKARQFAEFERLRAAEAELQAQVAQVQAQRQAALQPWAAIQAEEALRRAQKALAQAQGHAALQPSPQPAVAGSPIEVSVTSIRVTKISVPLDPAGQYEVSGRISTLERKFVTSFDEFVDHSGVVEKNLSLNVGTYRLDLVVKNQSDGSQATQTLNFEVK